MLHEKCKTCQNNILRHSRKIECCYCHMYFHFHCLDINNRPLMSDKNPWSCKSCHEYIFPFNHIENDNEFNFAISNYETVFDDNVFYSFTEYDNINEDVFYQYDPDVNFYNEATLNTRSDSKYYHVDSFKRYVNDSNSNNLSFVSMNIRSAPKNLDNFVTYLNVLDFEFSCIGLVETWYNNTNVDIYNIEGYKHEYLHRIDKKGGGVSLYLRNFINYIKRDDITQINDNFECLFVEIDKSIFKTEANIVVGSVYRVPNTDQNKFTEYIDKVYSLVNHEKKLLYVMGDVNINLLNCDTDVNTNDFVNVNFNHGMMPLINKPTRITNHSSTLIDNIFTNNMSVNMNSGILILGLTDHFPVFSIEKTNVHSSCDDNNNFALKRCFTEKNNEKFLELLGQSDFNEVMCINDAQLAFTKFQNIILTAYNNAYPLSIVNIKYKNRKPWLTRGLIHSIRNKNRLYVRYTYNRSNENELKYKTYRNKLNHILRIAEKQHITSLLEKEKHNIKRTWGIIKEIINKKKSSNGSAIFKHYGKEINDKK